MNNSKKLSLFEKSDSKGFSDISAEQYKKSEIEKQMQDFLIGLRMPKSEMTSERIGCSDSCTIFCTGCTFGCTENCREQWQGGYPKANTY